MARSQGKMHNLSFIHTKKAKQSTTDGGTDFQWVDGMYDSFTNFALGEPSIKSETACYLISSKDQLGQWYSTMDCNSPKPYVCKLELKSAIPDWSDGYVKRMFILCRNLVMYAEM